MIGEDIIETVIGEMTQSFHENIDCFSKTRDVFTARIQSYVLETKKYLEAAIIGEIGNNTFDHNSSRSPSVKGCLAILDFSGEN